MKSSGAGNNKNIKKQQKQVENGGNWDTRPPTRMNKKCLITEFDEEKNVFYL